MEQEAETTSYSKLTKDLIRENSLAFGIGGLIFFGALFSIGLRYGDGLQQMLSKQSSNLSKAFNIPSVSNERLNEIAKSVKDESIDYISPDPQPSKAQAESLGIVAEENGQISAITSGQVTYKKNRYTIQPGEGLQDVARKVYGDPNAWVRIARANNITNPDHIEVGMELIIPR